MLGDQGLADRTVTSHCRDYYGMMIRYCTVLYCRHTGAAELDTEIFKPSFSHDMGNTAGAAVGCSEITMRHSGAVYMYFI